MMFRALGLLLVGTLLVAESLFDQAKTQYDDGNLTESLELFKASATHDDDEEAAFYLGNMYDQGIGTPRDANASHYWYQKASQRYYRLSQKQIDYEIDKDRRRFVRALDLNDTDTVEAIQQKISSAFGLKAHHANYFLPVSCGDFAYKSYTPSDSYRQCEAEVQLSFKFDLVDDLLGFDEIYTLGYTQHSFWQIYATSKPFRETNYNPEFMVSVFRDDEFGDVSLKALLLTVAHQSNGQGNITEQGFIDADTTDIALLEEHPEWGQNRSRSWNYLSFSAIMQYHELFAQLTGWWRFPEDKQEDENPGLTDYIGQGSLQLYYPSGRSLTRLELRYNFKHAQGSAELDWTYPVAGRTSTYWYVKFFTGYGESLIDYNNYINKFAIGLSFSR